MSSLVSGEDLIEKVFLPWRVVNHDRIMEGDLVIRKAPSGVWSLIETSLYELYQINFLTD